MSAELREEAIVLGSVDYGESDRIVTLFTRGQGKVGAFARGARASRKRFAGALEPFTELEVRLRAGRGDLLRLESCSIRDAFLGLRGSLEGIVYAGHAAELCRELTREREPHEGLYELLPGYLRALAAGKATPDDLLAFELQVLGEAGFAPRLDACARCGGDVLAGRPAGASEEGGIPAVRDAHDGGGSKERRGAPGARCAFDPAQGGLLCPRCAGGSPQGRLVLRPDDLAALRALQILPVGRARERLPDGGLLPAIRQTARRAIRRTTHSILGRNPRSLDLFRQLGVDG